MISQAANGTSMIEPPAMVKVISDSGCVTGRPVITAE